jgi:hypothetical protein
VRARASPLLRLLPRAQLVALAGLVWNPPGSCAWAARVYVSSAEAQRHGVKVREKRKKRRQSERDNVADTLLLRRAR